MKAAAAVIGLYTRETPLNLGLLTGFGITELLLGRLNEITFRYVAIALVVAGGGMLLGRELLG